MLNILSVFRVQAIFRVKIAPGTVDRRAIRGPAVPSNRLLRMCPFFRLRGPDRRRSQYRAAVVLAQFQCDRSNWPGSRFGCWFPHETVPRLSHSHPANVSGANCVQTSQVDWGRVGGPALTKTLWL